MANAVTQEILADAPGHICSISFLFLFYLFDLFISSGNNKERGKSRVFRYLKWDVMPIL